MELKEYLIYRNEVGTDLYPIGENETAEDAYERVLHEHGDAYDETTAFYVTILNNEVTDAGEVYLPEEEDFPFLQVSL